MNKEQLVALKSKYEQELTKIEKELKEIENVEYWDLDDDQSEEINAMFWIRKGKIELLEELLK
jgi:hypothetical protein